MCSSRYQGHKLQEETVELEPQAQKDKDSKSCTKPRTGPVIDGPRYVELGDQYCSPNPPFSLQSDNDPESFSGT